jgi:hypothetical protein
MNEKYKLNIRFYFEIIEEKWKKYYI